MRRLRNIVGPISNGATILALGNAASAATDVVVSHNFDFRFGRRHVGFGRRSE